VSGDSTRPPSAGKAARKPGKDFPLPSHKETGRWCKKVRGRVYHFGKIADGPTGAAKLDLWLAQKDDLLAGRGTRPKTDGLPVSELADRFLTAEEHVRETCESPGAGREGGDCESWRGPAGWDCRADSGTDSPASSGKDWR
jgi:hypothetical protein